MLTVNSPTTSKRQTTKQSPIKVVCYSVVPSPYQRDLFYALSCLPEVDITVFYWEASISDLPWPEKPLQPYEQIMPGQVITWGDARFHINWHLPKAADVMILNGYTNSVVQLILHGYAKKIPCIFWGESIVADSGGIKGQIQRLLAKGLNNCQAIAAIGSKAEQDYRKQFPNKPVFNIPYYCDLSKFEQLQPSRPRKPIIILFCGQMIQRKGVDLLLQAFSQLIAAGDAVRLLLVGREAELPTMLNEVPKLAREHIEFVGFQAPEDLPSFFQQADIFVLPSRYDGWGVVVNQALGAGLPIICSDAVGAAQDLIEPGKNGFIFPNGNVEALFSVLKHFCENPEHIYSSSQSSAQKAHLWTPKVGAKRWLHVLESTIATQKLYL